jgi:hypothetical protein
MFRRVLCFGTVALAALALGASAILADPAGPLPAASPRTTSVSYRGKGKADWQLFGVYRSEQDGREIFNHLSESGFQVKLEVTNRPIPATPRRPASGARPPRELVKEAKAVEVFKWMARQRDIAFRYPIDGCYARAQLMVERLQKQGFYPFKVWAFANGHSLYARTPNHPRGYVTWSYHVAPVLRVRHENKTQRWYVIDPSLFDRPVPIAQWEQAMRKNSRSHRPYLTVTRIGHPPTLLSKKKAPGSGYWPAADPSEGLHAHAVRIMRKYKLWEGKQPPRGAVRGLSLDEGLGLALVE